MMRDGQLDFVSPNGAPISVVGAAGATIVFPGVIDLAGSGVGSAPANIIGQATYLGFDAAIGIWDPEVTISISTAFTTSNSATGEFCVQGAPDTGTTPGVGTPGTWEDFATTGAKTAAQLIVSTPGNIIRLKFPPSPPDDQTPRFYRLILRVPSATNFSAGAVSWAGVTQGRDDLQFRKAANNYVVA
jgi:hypothetical protein